MKKEKKRSKLGTFIKRTLLVFLGLFVALFIFGLFLDDPVPSDNETIEEDVIIADSIVKQEQDVLTEQDTTPKTPLTWEETPYKQQESWIQNYLDNPDEEATVLNHSLRHLVASKFNYPKSVDFNFVETPFFSGARIIDAYSGVVFIEGGGSAQNAYGMESDFTYIIKLVITQPDQHIKAIEVYQ